MFDFPNSPTVGALYQAPGGPEYRWDGEKWVMSGNAIYPSTYLQTQIKTASGAITLHAETRYFSVEVQGGGGGGGGTTSGASQCAAAAGGGGGAYVSKWIVRPTGTYSPTCTVGALGAGGSGAVAGTAGGASTFTDGTYSLSAGGGAGGGAATGSIMSTTSGGAGGTATGGDINAQGDFGGWSSGSFFSGYAMARSGLGACTRFGTGGQSVGMINNVAQGINGGSTGNWGAGGSGGASVFGNSSTGGNGCQGCVILTEFR